MISEGKKTEEEMITLRPACEDDMQEVLAWRNHPETRMSSFKTDIITAEAHEAWFKRKLASSESSMYVALSGADKIGIVRFDDAGEIIKVSVMLNPAFFGKGLGSRVISGATQRYLKDKKPSKPVIAEIKTSNAPSIKAFEKAGFKSSFITLIHEGKVN